MSREPWVVRMSVLWKTISKPGHCTPRSKGDSNSHFIEPNPSHRWDPGPWDVVYERSTWSVFSAVSFSVHSTSWCDLFSQWCFYKSASARLLLPVQTQLNVHHLCFWTLFSGAAVLHVEVPLPLVETTPLPRDHRASSVTFDRTYIQHV